MKRTKSSHVLTVLAFSAFTVVVLVGIMLFAGFWTFSNTYTLSAYVPNARGIATDSTVFEAGLPVGLVTGLQRHGPDAILTLRLTGGPTPLPTDTKIQLGLRSIAGEADVLLYPGHARTYVRNGGSLPIQQDDGYTEVDQILNALAGSTERHTREFFQAAGYGLRGEGTNLNDTLGNAAELINNSPPLTSTLASQHQQVADIVQNFGNIMGAIGDRTQALQEFATGAIQTFDAVSARNAALKKLLRNLPYGANGVGTLGGAINANEPAVLPVVLKLNRTIRALSPAVHLLSSASSKGIEVVNALGAAAPQLRNVLADVQRLEPSATAALPAVHAVTCQLNPFLRFIAPYGPDLAQFFENFGANMDTYFTGAHHSHEIYLTAMVDPTHFIRGIAPQPVSNALQTLFNAGIFAKLGSGLGYDPAHGPGGLNDKTTGLGDYGPVDFGANHTYPHVVQDCST
jgi:phospholipid/cholesterol/gamma-HCH transport system substrate-binding protein